MVRIGMLAVYFSILTLYINIKISMFNLIASVRFFFEQIKTEYHKW